MVLFSLIASISSNTKTEPLKKDACHFPFGQATFIANHSNATVQFIASPNALRHHQSPVVPEYSAHLIVLRFPRF